jgi:hypothetical protein
VAQRKSVPYVIGARPAEWKEPLEGFNVKLTTRDGKVVKAGDALVVVDQSPPATALVDPEVGVTLVVETAHG